MRISTAILTGIALFWIIGSIVQFAVNNVGDAVYFIGLAILCLIVAVLDKIWAMDCNKQ